MVNTLTLNPAIDRVLYLNTLVKNVTNRIQNKVDTIGGKGTHVSINLSIMGQKNRLYGIVHGNTGLNIIEMLSKYELDVRFIHKPDAQSRTNYLLVEDNLDCTLIAEKGVPLTGEDLQRLTQKMDEEIAPGDTLVIAGDASNYADPTVYNQILNALREKKLKVFLDTSGDYLQSCLEESPFLIKPNHDELSALVGRPICNSNDVIAAMEWLGRYNIEVIAVSLGGEGSLVKFKNKVYKAVPPKVRVINTVGCGDCFLAGLIYGFSNGSSIEEILRCATAVSAAAAESPLSVGFDPDCAATYMGRVDVTEVC